MYLFSNLNEDHVFQALSRGRMDEALYHALIDFCTRQAYTTHSVKEYLIRRMLEQPLPDMGVYGEAVSPYLTADIKEVFETAFRQDWDAVLRGKGLLPFPAWRAPTAPGEDAYKAIVLDMVASGSEDALLAHVKRFYSRYRCAREAMHRAFVYDGTIKPVLRPDAITFDALYCMEYQRGQLLKNTRKFMQSLPCNDVLLIGARGTGKSSCVKAALNHFAHDGLKLVELSNDMLHRLNDLLDQLEEYPSKFIVFMDDLTFEEPDEAFLALKVALEGGIRARPDNVLFYATSNRRNLIRESWRDRGGDEEIHQNDVLHEKLSLSERFGLRLHFPVLGSESYLHIVRQMLTEHGISYTEQVRQDALAWGIEHGQSGRSAKSFVSGFGAGLD